MTDVIIIDYTTRFYGCNRGEHKIMSQNIDIEEANRVNKLMKNWVKGTTNIGKIVNEIEKKKRYTKEELSTITNKYNVNIGKITHCRKDYSTSYGKIMIEKDGYYTFNTLLKIPKKV